MIEYERIDVLDRHFYRAGVNPGGNGRVYLPSARNHILRDRSCGYDRAILDQSGV